MHNPIKESKFKSSIISKAIFSILFAFCILTSLLGLHYVYADEFRNNYINPEGDTKIEFPYAWTMTQHDGIQVAFPGVSDDNGTKTSRGFIALSTFNRSSLQSDLSNVISQQATKSSSNSDDCSDPSDSYLKVNDMSALKTTEQCNGVNNKMKSIVYTFFTKDKIISLSYAAASPDEFDLYMPVFERSLQTLKIDNVMDFQSAQETILHLNPLTFQAQLNGSPVNVKLDTSSKISNFTFSESNKKVSFTVSGDDQIGFTFVSLGNILKAPYTVTFDGNTVTDFETITDQSTGDTMIKLTYHQSAHDVVITGASAVPEFPLAQVVLVASVISVISLYRIGFRK